MVLDRPRTSPTVRAVWLLALAALLLIPILAFEQFSSRSQLTLTPQLSHPSGYYYEGFYLKLAAEPNATVRYTLDGSAPSPSNGFTYSSPIWIDDLAGVVVIRSSAIAANGEQGDEVSASYFMGIDSTLPLISVTTDPTNLWDPNEGIIANPFQRGREWEREAKMTYVDVDRISTLEAPMGLRIHGGVTRRYDKKSFRLYFREAYGQDWINYRLFSEHQVEKYERIVLHSGGQDALEEYRDWSLIRNQLVSQFAFEVGGLATHSRPVLLFINGEPWGIYLMRERIDESYLESNFGITDATILDTPELNQRGEEPEQAQWDNLMVFVENNDLSESEHYSFIESQIDVDNYIDYNIIQMYSGNIDWPHRNVNLFRPNSGDGRWQWIFWDNDSAFALNGVSKLDENMVGFATHPEVDGTVLLRKLMENDGFRNKFTARAELLLSTVLAPENVSAHIDRLAAELEPNLLHESGRWGNSLSWEQSIDELHEFAEKRPDIMRDHLKNYLIQFESDQ
ncbi:MAG: CotH kinase family protein [Chloroflexota bacterium]